MKLPYLYLLGALLLGAAAADDIFIEAETFVPSNDGWEVNSGPQARRASRATTLWGASGAADGTASRTVSIPAAGSYRVWVRHIQHDRWRGAYRLALLRDGNEIASKSFDLEPRAGVEDWEFLWDFLDADLPEGEVTFVLAKHENKNCVGYVRHVDCFLVTTDPDAEPDYVPHGPQTYLRATVGDIYDRPVYVHIFADHYRSPWYGHYALSKDGTIKRVAPRRRVALLNAGESTPWCNISPMLYHDSGARLVISLRYAYTDIAPRLKARFEFASAPDEAATVIALDEDRTPGGLIVIVPPDLSTTENVARFRTDRAVAEETGRIADSATWPEIGTPPAVFPFLVSASFGHLVLPDQSILDRERKTLAYFGFSNDRFTRIPGRIWYRKDDCYNQPDVERMRKRATASADAFRESGGKAEDIDVCRLTDEPCGEPSEQIAECSTCGEVFRDWLRGMGKTPEQLLVADWDEVKPVAQAERDAFPALHYFTQRFRTRSLSKFMRAQREALQEAYGARFTVDASFSDGAIFFGNFYGQGVDYFELMDSDDQNSLFVSDWSNLAATFQCAAFNTELLRAATRERGQKTGQYLIAYSGRTPWDIKLKGVSEVVRGLDSLENFSYGPTWAGHEGGQFWRSTAWYARPETWYANAELVREVGWAEDFLVPGETAPTPVALLYSSSTDIWMLKRNNAFGFERMNTWLALTHGQVPVDILSEAQVARGGLDRYRVCYLAGPNITVEASSRVRDWVGEGGVLVLSAGAGTRDEYSRPMAAFADIVPAERGELETLQPLLSAGHYVRLLREQDRVQAGAAEMEVLSVRETLTPRPGAEVLGTFSDGSPALVRGKTGRGTVYAAGFLPAVAYVKSAVEHRHLLKEAHSENPLSAFPEPERVADDTELLKRSYNPWRFPADIRDLLLRPVRDAGVELPLACDTPLVDARAIVCDEGILIALANYTLQPLAEIRLTVTCPRLVERVESVHAGAVQFGQAGDRHIEFRLPLRETDFVKCHYRDE